MRLCKVCGVQFVAKAWNSSVCSGPCRSEKERLAKAKWHSLNKIEENRKSRLRMAQYSKEELYAFSRKSRIKRGLGVLVPVNCIMCDKLFNPRSHKSNVCSIECKKSRLNQTDREYSRKRYRSDIHFKLTQRIRTRINKAVKRRSISAVKALGCSMEEFVAYIESLFWPGMTWDNYGEWHMDHIRALSNFDLTDTEQYKIACHYTNLQPLWAEDNIMKGNLI